MAGVGTTGVPTGTATVLSITTRRTFRTVPLSGAIAAPVGLAIPVSLGHPGGFGRPGEFGHPGGFAGSSGFRSGAIPSGGMYGSHSGAFSGFNHGGVTHGFAARGSASAGGFHGGGFRRLQRRRSQVTTGATHASRGHFREHGDNFMLDLTNTS